MEKANKKIFAPPRFCYNSTRNQNKLTTYTMLEGVVWWQAVIAIALAVAPIVIWTQIFFKRGHHSAKSMIEVFILGTFTVIPLIAIQYLWYLHPEWDVNTYIEESVYNTNVQLGFLATFVVIGVMEEIVKMGVVRVADASKMRLQTINDAVRFSIMAALGFAFSENIHYFYTVMSSGNLGELFSTVVFRGTFTVCAHMIFSAIFGYFYGMGKFSQHIMEQQEWTGEEFKTANFLNKTLKIPKKYIVKYQKLMTGLFIAMGMHALFNFFLQLNRVIEAIIIIVAGFIYVQYLMHRKAGHLVLDTAGDTGKASLMAKTDQDVVLELVGMWFNEGNYKDVIEICERLLMRDPDNKVVKLFKAKALDKAKVDKAMGSIKSLFSEKEHEAGGNILQQLRDKKTEMEKIEIIKGRAEKLLDDKPATPEAPAQEDTNLQSPEQSAAQAEPPQQEEPEATPEAPAPAAPEPEAPTAETPPPSEPAVPEEKQENN